LGFSVQRNLLKEFKRHLGIKRITSRVVALSPPTAPIATTGLTKPSQQAIQERGYMYRVPNAARAARQLPPA
jgi:hypothetical protein